MQASSFFREWTTVTPQRPHLFSKNMCGREKLSCVCLRLGGRCKVKFQSRKHPLSPLPPSLPSPLHLRLNPHLPRLRTHPLLHPHKGPIKKSFFNTIFDARRFSTTTIKPHSPIVEPPSPSPPSATSSLQRRGKEGCGDDTA